MNIAGLLRSDQRRLLVNEVWAIRLPITFNPWVALVPVETVFPINIPVASVRLLLKFIVGATIATVPTGVKVVDGAIRSTVTVPVEIKTIFPAVLKGEEPESIEISPLRTYIPVR